MRFGFLSVFPDRAIDRCQRRRVQLVVKRGDSEKSNAGKPARPEGARRGDPKHLHDWSDGRRPTTELVFIDPAVEDIEGLIAGLRQTVEPCVLDDCSPAIAQMATALRGT